MCKACGHSPDDHYSGGGHYWLCRAVSCVCPFYVGEDHDPGDYGGQST